MSKKPDGPGQPYGLGNRMKETEPSVHRTNVRNADGTNPAPQFSGGNVDAKNEAKKS